MATTPTGLPTLPEGGGAAPSSPLMSFADSLDAAVNLARKSRNASSVDMMKPYQGTVAASDFSSILNNLNTASDQTSSSLLKKVSDITSGKDLLSVSEAKDLGVPYGTTKEKAASMGIVPKNTTNDILVKSGALDYTKQDYSADASALEQSRGSDGWVDPTVYQKLYDAWVVNGGKIADFVKTYPPEQYVNPANDWLPPYLRPKGSGRSV